MTIQFGLYIYILQSDFIFVSDRCRRFCWESLLGKVNLDEITIVRAAELIENVFDGVRADSTSWDQGRR